MNMMNEVTVQHIEQVDAMVKQLYELVGEKKLTLTDLRKVWYAEKRLGKPSYGQLIGFSEHMAPADFQGEWHGGFNSYRHLIAKRLHEQDPALQQELPRVTRMLYGLLQKNPGIAADEIASLIREMLKDPHHGKRVLAAIARGNFLEYFSEEEGWVLLDQALQAYGLHIGGHWAASVRELVWSHERLLQFMRDRIKEPEAAGAFLANKYAQAAWCVFENVQELVEIIGEAAKLAPYEANLNRLWIAEAIGEIKSGKRDLREPGWENWAEDLLRDMAPIGLAEADVLVAKATEHLMLAVAGKEIPLSRCSMHLVERIKKLPADGELSSIIRISEILIDLPDCQLGRELLAKVLKGAVESDMARRYRLLLSPRRRFSRDWFLLDIKDREPYWYEERFPPRANRLESKIKGSWYGQAMRDTMTEAGWRFVKIEEHMSRNKKKQLCVKTRADSVAVYVFDERDIHRDNELYEINAEVMVRPTRPEHLVPFYESSSLVLYRVYRDTFPLVAALRN